MRLSSQRLVELDLIEKFWGNVLRQFCNAMVIDVVGERGAIQSPQVLAALLPVCSVNVTLDGLVRAPAEVGPVQWKNAVHSRASAPIEIQQSTSVDAVGPPDEDALLWNLNFNWAAHHEIRNGATKGKSKPARAEWQIKTPWKEIGRLSALFHLAVTHINVWILKFFTNS